MDRIARDVLSIAAGYLGAMVGETYYDVIEAIQDTWFAWTLSEIDAGRHFDRWQDAWHGWLAAQR